MRRSIVVINLLAWSLIALNAQDQSPERDSDSSPDLPAAYADFLIAEGGYSPDHKMAVIYPKKSVCVGDDDATPLPDRCQDYLVRLQPFQILTKVASKSPEFEGKNHGGMSAEWSEDGKALLVTLDSKWGPGEIFLYELRDGRVVRSTALLKKVHDLLRPDFEKVKSGRYNDYYDFIFDTGDEGLVCRFADATHVKIHGNATTDPKYIPGEKAWDGLVEAVWNIPAARFTSQKVTRIFAGIRKEQPE
jgi:hypothetical protein